MKPAPQTTIVGRTAAGVDFGGGGEFIAMVGKKGGGTELIRVQVDSEHVTLLTFPAERMTHCVSGVGRKDSRLGAGFSIQREAWKQLVSIAALTARGATYEKIFALSRERHKMRECLRRVPSLRAGGNQNPDNDPKYEFSPKCIDDEEWLKECAALRKAWAKWDSGFVSRDGEWVDDMAGTHPRSVIPEEYDQYIEVVAGGGYRRK